MLPEGKPQLVLNVPLCTGEGVIVFNSGRYLSLEVVFVCVFLLSFLPLATGGEGE